MTILRARARSHRLAGLFLAALLPALALFSSDTGIVHAASVLAVDAQVSTHQGSAGGSITSPSFSTHQAGELVLAFLASDGPGGSAQSFASVSGGGLSWTRRARANTQPGTAEIWQAVASSLLTSVTVTGTRASGSFVGALTVVSFTGADTTNSGTTATAAATSGAPTVSLTTSAPGSWVWGVGNDWDKATGRVVGAGQTMVDQYLAPVGDTYWVQRQTSTTPASGTVVTTNDTAPANDHWDLAAIEVLPGNSVVTQPPTPPTNLAANIISAVEVDLSWTASTSTVGIAGYNITRNGAQVGTSTSTTYNDTTVSPSTSYTYSVAAVDNQGTVSTPSNSVSVTTPAGNLGQTGQWGPVIPWPNIAVHGALLTNGNILTWGHGPGTANDALPTVWDPASGTFTTVPDPTHNPGCGGMNMLPDGRIIGVGGGSALGRPGVKTVTAFTTPTASWAQLADTGYITWYASTTVLPNGKLLRLGGVNGCNNCNPELPEVYTPSTNTWAPLTSSSAILPMYPFTYVRPNGTVAVTGASEVPSPLRIFDPNAQTWTTTDSNTVDGGSAAMYDLAKVIKAGSATDSGMTGASAKTAYTTDLGQASPQWTQTGSMAFPRSFLNLTPLPDGTVLATGGETTRDSSNLNNGVLPAEDWNPATGQWTTLASMTVPRMYHSIAILMPDGRVLVAGTGDDAGAGVPEEFSAQIFSPPYLFNGTRPTITSSPSVAQYGANFSVNTPDAASIRSVSLIRSAAVTHAFDESARRIALPFTAAGGVLNVQGPADSAAAPPGNYLLFIVNNLGVPSVAPWVHLPSPSEDAVPPSAPTNLEATATSATSVSLGWTASTDNIAVAGYNIIRNGTPVATSPVASYTDNSVMGNTTYTYSVTAFDAAGNVSQPSNTVQVTTPVGTHTPIAIDAQVSTHAGSASSSIASPTFSTTQGNELLEAFISTDGSGSSAQSVKSVSGGGLSWTMRARANGRAGTAEIWQAVAPASLSNVSVTATYNSGPYFGSIEVAAFTGANTSTNGATATFGAASGAPSGSLTTTAASSWVWGVGDDWDNATSRTMGANQALVDQYLPPSGDTFWVQRQNTTTPLPGTAVTINDTAPTADRWNLALIEIPGS